MSESTHNEEAAPQFDENEQYLPPARQKGFRLLRKILAYHLTLLGLLLATAAVFPGFMEYLPIGGVTALADGPKVSVSAFSDYEEDEYDGDADVEADFAERTASMDVWITTSIL